MGYYFVCFLSRVPPHANAQNTFKEWDVAFHGTAPQNVRSILDTGGLVVHGELKYICNNWLNWYIDFTAVSTRTATGDASVNKIVVSPSIKYTECEKFTKCKV